MSDRKWFRFPALFWIVGSFLLSQRSYRIFQNNSIAFIYLGVRTEVHLLVRYFEGDITPVSLWLCTGRYIFGCLDGPTLWSTHWPLIIGSREGFCGGFLPVALVVALLNLICLLIRVHFCSFLLIHDYFWSASARISREWAGRNEYESAEISTNGYRISRSKRRTI